MIANLVITQTKRQKTFLKPRGLTKTKRFVTYDFVCSFFFSHSSTYQMHSFPSFFHSFFTFVLNYQCPIYNNWLSKCDPVWSWKMSFATNKHL